MFDLLPVAAAFLVVAVSPGPANLALAGIALRDGRRAAMLFAAGLALGLAAWGVVAATGIGALLQASATALTVMKLAGGLYLLWLALGAARSAARPGAPAPSRGVRAPFLAGLMLNLSNPKAVAAWMAALSMGLGAGDEAGTLALATVLCALIGLGNYVGHALLFSLPGPTAVYARCRRGVEAAMAALFALGGLALLRSALVR